MMQAFRIHSFGDLGVLQRETIAIPEPAPGEVLIRVAAAGVNPVDYKTRAGRYPLVREAQLPYTLGRDLAGVVQKAGSSRDNLDSGHPAHVGALQPGSAVYAFVGQGQGAFAEYVVMPSDGVARKPVSLDFPAAAAVPLAALTAWQGLFEHGGVQAGQRVLIHAGAGGVGHFAVQLAKAKGAKVYATASGDALAFVEELGADVVVDYQHEDFVAVAHAVDMVFDLIGGATQERSWEAVKDGGALISTITEPSRERAAARGIRVARYTAQPNAGQLIEIGQLIDAGQVKVHLSKTFHFADAVQAQRRLEAGHVRGKMVLDLALEGRASA